MSVVQTFLAQKTADYFSKQLGNVVQIDRLEVDFFNKIKLNKVYVSDQNEDTLLYVDNFSLALKLLNIEKKSLNVEIKLSQPYFNLLKVEGEKDFNHQFIVDYFASESSTEAKKGEWSFRVTKLDLANGKFNFHDYNVADSLTTSINYYHLRIDSLNLLVSGVDVKSLFHIDANVNHLSAREASGFYLKHLEGDLAIRSETAELKNAKIQTEDTDIALDLRFTADSYTDYKTDFVALVHMAADISKSTVQMDDIAYFAPTLEGIDTQVFLDGSLRGTVSNLKGRDVKLFLNKETVLYGDFDFRGLPDVENTFIYFDMDRFETTANGLRSLPYPPFEEKKPMTISENVDRLGKIAFKGNFTGYYNDFVAYGALTSSLGSANLDMLVKEEAEQFYYRGKVESEGFDLGSFLDIEKMGKIALNVELNGSGLSKETINAKAKGAINVFEFADYSYEDIQLNAGFSQQTFDGELKMHDENIELGFNGSIDASKKLLFSDFSVDIVEANLAKLNLFNQEDSLTTLSLKGDINLVGLNFDEIEGIFRLDSIIYSDKDRSFIVDSVELVSIQHEGNRHLNLSSDLAQAQMSGYFQLGEMGVTARNLMAHYFRDEELQKQKALQKFNFDVNLINLSPVTELFLPDLEVDSNIKISGYYNSDLIELDLFIGGNSLAYKATSIEKYIAKIESTRDSMSLFFRTSSLKASEAIKLGGVRINGMAFKESMKIDAIWKTLNNEADSGNIDILAKLKTFDALEFEFVDSEFLLKNRLWDIVNNNQILIKGDSVLINNFHLESEEQYLDVNGIISKSLDDSLKIGLQQFNLSYLSEMLPDNILEMSGIANGEVLLKDIYSDFTLTSNLVFDSLEINTIEIGKGFFESKWNTNEKKLLVDGSLGEKEQNILLFGGEVFPSRKEESLDLRLQINRFPLFMISRYLDEYVSDVNGYVSGDIKVGGVAKKPHLDGKIAMIDVGLTLNLLNTHYQIKDEVVIKTDYIGFDGVRILDKNGNKAIATGTITHDNFKDYLMNIDLEYNNFLALNTTAKHSDLYYGTAVCSGTANISNDGSGFVFNINARALRGTDFKIPLEAGVEVSSSDFLIFTNSGIESEEEEEAINLTGIQMNFDLDIGRDAKVQIIFDEKIGDILEATGDGNLKLEINTLGNFNIYGQYIIDKGDYLFTLKNVINKRFSLAKGSKISWDGDPYKAKIDMKAIYNLRASLVDIMGQDSITDFKRRVPVELELQMRGLLLTPDIGFDIRLPGADDEIKRRLESVLYVNSSDVNLQEMNQQVFGLLIFNRFMTPSTGSGAETGVSRSSTGLNNGYEFLSNQMSNWLSQVSDQFDVGVNYRQGDEYSGDEFDLSLSTGLFEDRLILDGNLGYTSDTEYMDNQERSNFIGEFSLEYKLSKDGRFRLKGFNRSTNNSLLQTNSPYTQGVGLFYRQEFDSFKELWHRMFKKSSEG